MDLYSLWVGMPEFKQIKIKPFKKCKIFIDSDSSYINIRFENKNDFNSCGLGCYYDGHNFYVGSRTELSSLIKQKITNKTKSIWHPHKPHKDPDRGVYVYDNT
jgi:hypothetical protein